MKELLNMTIEDMIKEMCKDGEITIEDIKDEYEFERSSQSAHECTGRDVSSFENFVKYVYNEDFKED